MSIMGEPGWAYHDVWENIHDAIELLVTVKSHLPELEEPNQIANELNYPRLVEASMKINKAAICMNKMNFEE